MCIGCGLVSEGAGSSVTAGVIFRRENYSGSAGKGVSTANFSTFFRIHGFFRAKRSFFTLDLRSKSGRFTAPR